MLDMDLLKSGLVSITADRYEALVMNKNELLHTQRKLWSVQDELDEVKKKLELVEMFFKENSYEKHEFDNFVAKIRKELEENGGTEKASVCLDCQSR